MAPLSRRAFVKRTLGAGAVLYLYANGGYRIVTAATGSETYRLRIVHTNDHHARIEPVEVTIQSTPTSVTRNFGGVARRKTMFDAIRAEVAAAADPLAKNILFLDAGDVFQGTLYFNQYGGKADQYFYNLLGYDLQTIGNHEFDRGDALLADYIKAAVYPVISANIVAGSDPLKSLITPTINAPLGTLGPAVILDRGGEKIGIFGLTTVETKGISSPNKDTIFLDPLVVQTGDTVIFAQKQVDSLKAAGATKIVALTHIGYAVDQELAAKTRGINIIIGGHSHTPLLPPASSIGPVGVASQGNYPTILKDLDGKDVVIVTDWEWGKWVGDLTVSFNASGDVIEFGSVDGKTGGAPKPVWADGIKSGRVLLAGELPDVGADTAFQNQIINVYKPPIATLQATIIGATLTDLNGGSSFRTQESNLGDLIADALRDKLLNLTNDNPENLPIVTIINSGGLRAPIQAGVITIGKVLEVLPFGNTVARVDVFGSQLLAALENGVSQVEQNAGRFPQVSGLKFTWRRYGVAAQQATPAAGSTPAKPGVKGSRIESVQVYDSATKTYVALDLTKRYRVVTNNFQLTGGDGYNAFTPAGDQAGTVQAGQGATNQLDTGYIMADVVQDYIKNTTNSTVNVKTEARITALSKIVLPLVTNAPATATR